MKRVNARPAPIFSLVKKLAYLLIFVSLFAVLALGSVTYLAHKGMSEAQVFLGYLYQGGLWVFPKDTGKAKNYFVQAAAKGNAEGQCALGELFAQETNYQDAAYWYLKSALQGFQRCEYNFGGLDFPNEKNVFELLKKEADKSNAFAEFSVGTRYIEGNGIQKNIEQGVYYLKKSALQGNEGAQIYLSGLYVKGEVVKQDYDEANKWLTLTKK